jgi:hypothetical protein
VPWTTPTALPAASYAMRAPLALRATTPPLLSAETRPPVPTAISTSPLAVLIATAVSYPRARSSLVTPINSSWLVLSPRVAAFLIAVAPPLTSAFMPGAEPRKHRAKDFVGKPRRGLQIHGKTAGLDHAGRHPAD